MAGCDAPPILRPAEHFLDLVALAVERLVMWDLGLAALREPPRNGPLVTFTRRLTGLEPKSSFRHAPACNHNRPQWPFEKRA
jgi:hypothetical protein